MSLCISAQLRPFIEGGVSVKIIESEHKVYTISLALDEMYRSDTTTISDLLSKGADPNLKPEGRDPPLIVATEKNLQDNVDCLIKAGAQLDDVCRDGDTAILMCCKKGWNYFLSNIPINLTYFKTKLSTVCYTLCTVFLVLNGK